MVKEITQNEVLALETAQEPGYIKVRFLDKKTEVFGGSISVLQKHMEGDFLRISRFFLINLNFVDFYDFQNITVYGKNYQISRRYRDKVNLFFKNTL